ncbi:MAG: hypothetical protein ACR2GD_01880 [Pyrinomonadaceae bacterium]
MIERPDNQNFIEKYAPPKGRIIRAYRPFWLPASNFYILAAAVAVAVFFLAWAILNEGEEQMPLVSAGLVASMILAGSVILREVILRSARYRLLLAQSRLDRNIKTAERQSGVVKKTDKLTIDKNGEILREIERKSLAAQMGGKFSENHWRVFELCHEYLHRSEKELEFANAGSPRIAVLRKSRDKVSDLHKYHLLAWSEMESRDFMQAAKSSATISKKLENAAKALTVLDSALEFYPGEQELIESAAAVKEFISTVRVSHWIEQAERFAFKADYKRAVNHYRDALFYLARENVKSEERDAVAGKINLEIEKIRKIANETDTHKNLSSKE